MKIEIDDDLPHHGVSLHLTSPHMFTSPMHLARNNERSVCRPANRIHNLKQQKETAKRILRFPRLLVQPRASERSQLDYAHPAWITVIGVLILASLHHYTTDAVLWHSKGYGNG